MGKKHRRTIRREVDETISLATDEQLRNLRAELGREINARGAELSEIRRRLDAVIHEISGRKIGTTSGLRISEHAVLRYLERVKGVDMAAVREEIAALAETAEIKGDRGYARRQVGDLIFGSDEYQGHITTVYHANESTVVFDSGWSKEDRA